SCLIWLDLVASLPLIKERILVIILLLHFLSLMLGSVLVLMLPLLEIGRAVQQECRDRSRMPSSAGKKNRKPDEHAQQSKRELAVYEVYLDGSARAIIDFGG